MAAASSELDVIGARAIPEFDGPSSELADWKRSWPVRPTFARSGVEYGAIVRPDAG